MSTTPAPAAAGTPASVPGLEEWAEIRGYDAQSRGGADSVTGVTRPGDRIFRGPLIDFEGFFDVSEYSLERLAALIGFVPPEEASAARIAASHAQSERDELRRELAQLKDRVRDLTLQNAELYDVIAQYEADEEADE